jgi:hypothetical protein
MEGPELQPPRQRSYSGHDPQKCGVAGSDRHDSDDGSFAVVVRPQFSQCPAGLVPAMTLFQSFIYAVACFQVAAFLPVLQRAVVVIPAKVLFLRTAVARVIGKEGDLRGLWLPEGSGVV